jgi:hypothetical protein
MVEARDAGLLVGISCSSFCAQLLMTRAFQLLPAARAASLNFLGVVYSHALVSGVLAKHTICCHNGVLWCPEGLLYYSSGHVCCATPS